MYKPGIVREQPVLAAREEELGAVHQLVELHGVLNRTAEFFCTQECMFVIVHKLWDLRFDLPEVSSVPEAYRQTFFLLR